MLSLNEGLDIFHWSWEFHVVELSRKKSTRAVTHSASLDRSNPDHSPSKASYIIAQELSKEAHEKDNTSNNPAIDLLSFL